jgi:hypothetical protein
MPTRQQVANSTRQRKDKLATCVKCHQEKSWTEFNSSPNRRPFGLSSSCKPCDLERKSGQKRSAWYRLPEESRAKSRDKQLRKNFGISAVEYDAMFQNQEGLCAICGQSETYIHHATQKPARLAVDHDHSTGKVRALLCGNCNKGLGCLKDDVSLLEKAIQYLKEHNNVN